MEKEFKTYKRIGLGDKVEQLIKANVPNAVVKLITGKNKGEKCEPCISNKEALNKLPISFESKEEDNGTV